MVNRKSQILQLQAVSKCKKQISSSIRKTENSKKELKNVELIADLDQNFDEPEIDNNISILAKHTPNEYPYQLRDFQDSNLTKHISQQLVVIKLMMMIMTILSMFLSRVNENASSFQNQFLRERFVLIGHSVISVTMVTMAIMKHIKIRELTIKQLIRFSPYQLNFFGINYLFVIQLIFLFIHPNLLTRDKYINLQQPIYGLYTKLSVNNVLEIIMLCRIYLVYNAIVSSTIYLSTRGSRICRIYGTNCNLYFGFKCMFNTRPLFFLTIIFVTMLFVFGEMVRLSEEGLADSHLGNFQNSLWCVMITMGTVGYGDVVPKTYLGRAILFFASITGIIISSLLILTLSTYLSMEFSENKAHITLQRLVLRDKLQHLAKGVMHQTAAISKLDKVQGQKQIKNLKKNTDDVKYILRKIKNLIDTDNVNEEMDRLFECLEDNMKETYLNQIKYVKALKDMHQFEADRIKDMKFSFTQEIQNIIRDR